MKKIILTLRQLVGVAGSPPIMEKCSFLNLIFVFRGNYSLKKLFFDAGLLTLRHLVGVAESPPIVEKFAFLCLIFVFRFNYSQKKLFLDAGSLPTGLKS